jgi:8-oxo-dGTP pyrophosphatase MutT (NUDIX family)
MSAQVAAIPYRVDDDGGIWVLLVRSRTRERWILPKGNVGPRMLPRRSAEREAFEEAGVLGRIELVALGSYLQGGEKDSRSIEVVQVLAFPMEVTDELAVWPEMHLRERHWFPMDDALLVVQDREIRRILRRFAASRRT